jgi:hypothetical protein
VGRKVGREQGRTVLALLQEMERCAQEMAAVKNVHLATIGDRFSSALPRLREATEWVVETYPHNPAAVAAGSVYYLKLIGITLGGFMLARSATVAAKQLEAGQGDPAFLRSKLLTTRFYADHLLPQTMSLCAAAMRGAESVLAVEEALL